VKALFRWVGVEIARLSTREILAATTGSALTLVLLMVCSHAVLIFAVPHGPLSQPWPLLGGHVVSAVIGVFCARHIPWVPAAAAFAVAISIAAMLRLRCLHPPGGATAMTAVIGGPAVHALGYGFILHPVLLNALIVLGLALAFDRIFRLRRYPSGSRPAPPSAVPPALTHEQLVAAIRSIDSFVDVSEDDLLALTRALESARISSR
jgi:CBS domain-containing membrane protein